MKTKIDGFLKRHTLVYADRQGTVCGKFYPHSKDEGVWVINYCGGMIHTRTKPKSLYEEIFEE